MAVDGGLRQLFRQNIFNADFISIESGFTERGIPDLEYCLKGGTTGWVEMKKTNGDSVNHIKTEQIGWLERRRRYGGRAFMAIRKMVDPGPRRVACDELHLILGEGARFARMTGLGSVPVAMRVGTWAGGPSRWDWGEVREGLRGDWGTYNP